MKMNNQSKNRLPVSAGANLKTRITGALLAASLLATAPANALTVDLVPVASSVVLGDLVQVDVRVSGLTDLTAPSLGAYDLMVFFDHNALHYGGTEWGNQLDLDGLGSMTLLDDSDADWGTLALTEISYDSIATLNDQQLDSFTLFSLFFTAAALGNTSVAPYVIALSDAEGLSLTADAITGGNVSVVPVPAALPLLASGLLLLLTRLRRRA